MARAKGVCDVDDLSEIVLPALSDDASGSTAVGGAPGWSAVGIANAV
jgi:hypothetical protein